MAQGPKALDVYGPKGLKAMTGNIFKAWEVDIHVRTVGRTAAAPAR